MRKATREQIREHNRRLVLRSIYEGAAETRARLALETGLTKPTISTIVSEYLDEGYVLETGPGNSTSSGGKRPTLLQFQARSRQIIAISVTRDQVQGALAYLDHSIAARHYIDVDQVDDLPGMIAYTIQALQIQLDAPLLCISVGLPGIVDDVRGVVVSSPTLKWADYPLAQDLHRRFGVPVYIGNSTEFAALTQVVLKNAAPNYSLVTLLVGDSIEVGSTFGRHVYHHGGSIAHLGLPFIQQQASFLEWVNLRQRAQELIALYPDSALANGRISFLQVRKGMLLEDAATSILVEEIAGGLASIYAWIAGLLRPHEIALAGSMSDLGHFVLDAVRRRIDEYQLGAMFQNIHLTLATSLDLDLKGAVIAALQKELGVL